MLLELPAGAICRTTDMAGCVADCAMFLERCAFCGIYQEALDVRMTVAWLGPTVDRLTASAKRNNEI
jgi:hypothetical protein